MRRSLTALLFAATAAFLSACQTTEAPKPGNTPANQPKPAASASPAAPAADPKVTDPAAKAAEFEGQWNGQGGSSLTISKKGETYTLEITKGGKAEKFEGVAKDGTILMKRGEKAETITVAKPEETGLTWAGGEKTCLVITKGSEAYCRK